MWKERMKPLYPFDKARAAWPELCLILNAHKKRKDGLHVATITNSFVQMTSLRRNDHENYNFEGLLLHFLYRY